MCRSVAKAKTLYRHRLRSDRCGRPLVTLAPDCHVLGRPQKVSVTVHVQDLSASPIPNATVQLTYDGGTSTVSTDSKGFAGVVGNFLTCGTDTLLNKTGFIELLREKLTVKADGFKDFHRELDEIVVSGGWDLYAPKPPEVLVTLERDNQVPPKK